MIGVDDVARSTERQATTDAPLPVTPRPGVGDWLRQTLALTRRSLLHIRNDPGQLIDAVVMPVVVGLIFVYVFGGAIVGGRENYTQFLMPGIMLQTITFGAAVTGLGLNLDVKTGVMDRLRSLPIARSAVLSGRILADTCRLLVGQCVILAFAFIVGFRIHTGVLPTVAAMLLLLAFGLALAWISALIGLSVSNPQTVQSVGFLWVIPLQFGSSLFVPAETMPGWLQAFAKVNPATLVVDACRGLMSGGPVLHSALGALAWIAGLLIIFVPLAVRRYRVR